MPHFSLLVVVFLIFKLVIIFVVVKNSIVLLIDPPNLFQRPVACALDVVVVQAESTDSLELLTQHLLSPFLSFFEIRCRQRRVRHQR